jgi:hypothetical protein
MLYSSVGARRCDSKEKCWHARLFWQYLHSFSNIWILYIEAGATTKLERGASLKVKHPTAEMIMPTDL